jgi:hypothetical protein
MHCGSEHSRVVLKDLDILVNIQQTTPLNACDCYRITPLALRWSIAFWRLAATWFTMTPDIRSCQLPPLIGGNLGVKVVNFEEK